MKSEKILDLSVRGIAYSEEQGSLDDYLDFKLKETECRNTVSSILFIYFRKKASIDFLIKSFVKTTPSNFLRRVLSAVFVQILYQTGIESYAATDIAVSYVKSIEGKVAGNFVNAVIRNLLRQLNNEETKKKLGEAASSVPKVLNQRWEENYSKDVAVKIVEAINIKPDFTFRALALIDDECCKKLKIKKISIKWANDFYIAEEPGIILNSSLMKEGKIYIQDPASTFFSTLINDLNLDTILDYCSAPGGKTVLLSSLFPIAKIIATDHSSFRLKRVEENVSRIGVKNVEIIDFREFDSKYGKELFDLILLDVPCSNTGVIRRRPDAMWKFSMRDLNRIAEMQKSILSKTSILVKKGGYILYSTCSIEPEENEKQVENFILDNPDFVVLRKEILLPSVNSDGAFVSLLKKQK